MTAYSDMVTDITTNGTRYHKATWSDDVRLFRVYVDSDGFETDSTGTAVIAIGDSSGSHAYPWQTDSDDQAATDYSVYNGEANNQGW